MDGCLCLLIKVGNAVDIWVMKEYLMKESWVKLLRLSLGRGCYLPSPLTYDETSRRAVLIKRRVSRGVAFENELAWLKTTDRQHEIAVTQKCYYMFWNPC